MTTKSSLQDGGFKCHIQSQYTPYECDIYSQLSLVHTPFLTCNPQCLFLWFPYNKNHFFLIIVTTPLTHRFTLYNNTYQMSFILNNYLYLVTHSHTSNYNHKSSIKVYNFHTPPTTTPSSPLPTKPTTTTPPLVD